MTTTSKATTKRVDLPAMKRADKRRADKALEYNRRDVRNFVIIGIAGTALFYTTLWLIAEMYS